MINWREPAVEDHSQQLELQTLTDTSFSSRKCKRHASLSVHSHFGLRARHCSLAFTAAYTIFQGASDELDCAPLAFVAVKEEISRYSSTGYRRSRSARLAPLHLLCCCGCIRRGGTAARKHVRPGVRALAGGVPLAATLSNADAAAQSSGRTRQHLIDAGGRAAALRLKARRFCSPPSALRLTRFVLGPKQGQAVPPQLLGQALLFYLSMGRAPGRAEQGGGAVCLHAGGSGRCSVATHYR